MNYTFKRSVSICLLALIALFAVSGCALREEIAEYAAQEYLLQYNIIIAGDQYTIVLDDEFSIEYLNRFIGNIGDAEESVNITNKTGISDFEVDESKKYTAVQVDWFRKDDIEFGEPGTVMEMVWAELYYEADNFKEPVLSFFRVQTNDNGVFLMPIDASTDDIINLFK